MSDISEIMSLIFQIVASFTWAIGAGLAGPVDVADFLQFFAAISWCLANFASMVTFYEKYMINSSEKLTIWIDYSA